MSLITQYIQPPCIIDYSIFFFIYTERKHFWMKGYWTRSLHDNDILESPISLLTWCCWIVWHGLRCFLSPHWRSLFLSFASRPKERHHGVHGVHSDQLLNLKGLISVHWKLGWCKKTPRKWAFTVLKFFLVWVEWMDNEKNIIPLHIEILPHLLLLEKIEHLHIMKDSSSLCGVFRY